MHISYVLITRSLPVRVSVFSDIRTLPWCILCTIGGGFFFLLSEDHGKATSLDSLEVVFLGRTDRVLTPHLLVVDSTVRVAVVSDLWSRLDWALNTPYPLLPFAQPLSLARHLHHDGDTVPSTHPSLTTTLRSFIVETAIPFQRRSQELRPTLDRLPSAFNLFGPFAAVTRARGPRPQSNVSLQHLALTAYKRRFPALPFFALLRTGARLCVPSFSPTALRSDGGFPIRSFQSDY